METATVAVRGVVALVRSRQHVGYSKAKVLPGQRQLGGPQVGCPVHTVGGVGEETAPWSPALGQQHPPAPCRAGMEYSSQQSTGAQ